jgi:hypothetical protein
MSDSDNVITRAGAWFDQVMKTAIVDDGVRQTCNFDTLIGMVQADSGSAQIVIQMLEEELKQRGAGDGVTLPGVWIAAAFLVTTGVQDEVVRHLRRFAPKICQRAMDLLKDQGMIPGAG